MGLVAVSESGEVVGHGGVTVMLAEVLPENADMLAGFREHFITSEKRQDGAIHVTFAITETARQTAGRALDPNGTHGR